MLRHYKKGLLNLQLTNPPGLRPITSKIPLIFDFNLRKLFFCALYCDADDITRKQMLSILSLLYNIFQIELNLTVKSFFNVLQQILGSGENCVVLSQLTKMQMLISPWISHRFQNFLQKMKGIDVGYQESIIRQFENIVQEMKFTIMFCFCRKFRFFSLGQLKYRFLHGFRIVLKIFRCK